MLKSLEIKNFRCFESFRLEQLGQVNLLVGSNNSGKTSILEALHLFFYRDYLATLCKIMKDRGEYINEQHETIENFNLIELKHLFYNRQIHNRQKIDIIGKHDNGQTNKLNMAIKQDEAADDRPNNSLKSSRFELFITWFDEEDITEELSSNLSDGQRLIDLPYEYDYDQDENVLKDRQKTEFVKSYSLTVNKMMELFDHVVLTPEEDVIIEALRKIEPGIDRIAPIASKQSYYSGSRSGFVVRIGQQRVPIGSMGDGIWRILGLILAIVNVKDGVLLVDEIDTGLHYSVMLDMWTIICQVAKRLNVQVFATTHNSDCWKSLAAVANSDNYLENGITIHRIEKGKPASIIFDEQEMMIAAERDIEVR